MRARTLVVVVAVGLLAGAVLLPGQGASSAPQAQAQMQPVPAETCLTAECLATNAANHPAYAAHFGQTDIFTLLSRAGH